MEEGKDQGVHVREKAKQMVILLKDDERLKGSFFLSSFVLQR